MITKTLFLTWQDSITHAWLPISKLTIDRNHTNPPSRSLSTQK